MGALDAVAGIMQIFAGRVVEVEMRS